MLGQTGKSEVIWPRVPLSEANRARSTGSDRHPTASSPLDEPPSGVVHERRRPICDEVSVFDVLCRRPISRGGKEESRMCRTFRRDDECYSWPTVSFLDSATRGAIRQRSVEQEPRMLRDATQASTCRVTAAPTSHDALRVRPSTRPSAALPSGSLAALANEFERAIMT